MVMTFSKPLKHCKMVYFKPYNFYFFKAFTDSISLKTTFDHIEHTLGYTHITLLQH